MSQGLSFKLVVDSFLAGDLEPLRSLEEGSALVNAPLGECSQSMIFSTANIPDKDKAVQALDLLLEKGAEINFLDSNRQTALFYWASKGNTACVKLAIESGALPDLQDINSQTALYYACKSLQIETVKVLVELGRCDINHVDGSGELAFFYAAKGGSVPIVKYMVEHGCNYLHKSLMKRTALTYAKKENKKEVAEYLTLLAKQPFVSAPCPNQERIFLPEEESDKLPPLPTRLPKVEQPTKIRRIEKVKKNKSKVEVKREADQDFIPPSQTKISLRINPSDTKIQLALHDRRLKRQEEREREEQVKREQEVEAERQLLEQEREKQREARPKEERKKKKDINSYKLVYTDEIGFCQQITLAGLMALYPQSQEISRLLTDCDYEGRSVEEVNAAVNLNWRRAGMRLLNQLWNSRDGAIFQKPVDPIRLRIFDYFDIVKEPMDLQTIKCKLITNTYRRSREFIREMLLIFDNCMRYNGLINEVGQAAMRMRELFLQGVHKSQKRDLFFQDITSLRAFEPGSILRPVQQKVEAL